MAARTPDWKAESSALAGDTAFLENQHIFLERHGYIEAPTPT